MVRWRLVESLWNYLGGPGRLFMKIQSKVETLVLAQMVRTIKICICFGYILSTIGGCAFSGIYIYIGAETKGPIAYNPKDGPFDFIISWY